jgi:hypothetical protein
MACSKYTLTNTGTSIANFSYRRCDDNMWEYQVSLDPSETKNIWLINGSYGTAFSTQILLVNQGPFPPLNATATPTPTPTSTPTPSVTQTQTPTQTTTTTLTPTPTTTTTLTATQTPTETSTPTPTPTTTLTATQTPTETSTPTPTGTAAVTPTPTNTNTPSQTPTDTPSSTSTPTPTRSKVAFTVYSGTTHDEACGQYNPTVTVYGNNSQFDLSTQFSNISTGDATINMTGFIQNSGYVSQLDTNGNVVGSVTICATLTPTPTMTPTNTQTPTTTPTTTPTRTFYQYSLGTGLTANDACVDYGSAPNTIYGTVSGGVGPNIGEYLYYNSGLTIAVANGYYSNGTAVFQVTGGLGQITAVDPTGC